MRIEINSKDYKRAELAGAKIPITATAVYGLRNLQDKYLDKKDLVDVNDRAAIMKNLMETGIAFMEISNENGKMPVTISYNGEPFEEKDPAVRARLKHELENFVSTALTNWRTK